MYFRTYFCLIMYCVLNVIVLLYVFLLTISSATVFTKRNHNSFFTHCVFIALLLAYFTLSCTSSHLIKTLYLRKGFDNNCRVCSYEILMK